MLMFNDWRAAILAATVALLCFIPFPVAADRLFWDPLFNGGHFGLFMSVALALYFITDRQIPNGVLRALVVLLGTAAAAGLVEVIQPFFGRSESGRDFAHGILGSAAGLAIAVEFENRRSIFNFAAVLACVAQLLFLRPAAIGLSAVWWRSTHFPELADFENNAQTALWQPVSYGRGTTKLGAVIAGRGQSLFVHVIDGKWNGVRYDAGLRDWTAYTTLQFDAFNPHPEPLRLNLRIDDDRKKSTSFAERFNRTLNLPGGWTTFRVPLSEVAAAGRSKPMNMRRIKQMLFFLNPQPGSDVFLLDNIRLIREDLAH